jgi:signal transduction histidine kinase
VPKPAAGVFVLASATFVAFGLLADGALEREGVRAQEAARREAAETARLTGLSVRAAVAQLEQRLLAGTVPANVVAWRLADAPPRAVPDPAAVPYASRPRDELVHLLSSRGTTASGLPEAIVARLVLGAAAAVSAPSGEPPTPNVAERLLEGDLPVRREDLPTLARALGVAGDPRVAVLAQRLESAPSAALLPRAPAFRRVRTGDTLIGWSEERGTRVHYEVPLVRVLADAHVDATLAVTGGDGSTRTSVPDVEGLTLAVPPRVPTIWRGRALRAALWIAVAASVAWLFVVRRALLAKARASAREKAFLANVTHELRTPLSSMRLFGERLAAGRGDPREYGLLVAEESQRLERLVEGVLAATRADARPVFAPCEPGERLRSAVDWIAPRAERRSVTVSCTIDDPLPTTLWDGEAVRGALLNLLDNAVKHGREGGLVSAQVIADGDAVSFTIADDGPGIVVRERRRLFQPFERGNTEAAGAGLGLHLVEQVAHAHGGHVDFTSDDGRGCVFTLRLPLEPPGARRETAGPS